MIVVRFQALLTQLVFDHSLRMRLKAEASGDNSSSQAETLSIIQEAFSRESSIISDASGFSHTARDETLEGSVKGKANSKGLIPDKAAKKHTGNAKDLVGKINNLVSSDLDAISDGADFLTFGMVHFPKFGRPTRLIVYTTVLSLPLQVILSIIFLSKVLGWRYDKSLSLIY